MEGGLKVAPARFAEGLNANMGMGMGDTCKEGDMNTGVC